jgi:hypothetical protein
MIPEDIERLRSYTDKIVRMKTTDGESLIVKVVLMQDEYQDFIYDLIWSDQEHRYRKPLTSCAYATPYNQIASFDLAEEGSY